MLLIVSGVFWHHPSHPRDTQYCIRVEPNEYGLTLIPADQLTLFCRNRGLVLKGMVNVPVVLLVDLIDHRLLGPPEHPSHQWRRTDIRGLYPNASEALDDFWKLGGKATLRDERDGDIDWRPREMLPEDYYAL